MTVFTDLRAGVLFINGCFSASYTLRQSPAQGERQLLRDKQAEPVSQRLHCSAWPRCHTPCRMTEGLAGYDKPREDPEGLAFATEKISAK